MKFLSEVKHPSGTCTNIWLHGDSEKSTRDAFLSNHPKLTIISMMEMPEWKEDMPTKNKNRTEKQLRAHHKARITQVRNNIISLIEDENSVLTSGERVQLTRISCKFTSLLSKWKTNSLNIELRLED
jgi:hypothetical protein